MKSQPGFRFGLFALAIAALPVCAAESNAPAEAALDARIRQQEAENNNVWAIQPYRPTYVLPVTYNTHVNNEPVEATGEELDPVEIKFQISFMLPLVQDLISGNGDLYMAYSQVSMWQAYNFDNSAPFRDTNYEPEFFLKFDTDEDLLGLKLRAVNLGAVHQSNGRGSEELSRSWNRLYANLLLERGNFGLAIKPWYRIPEDEEEDNNPNIEDFLGYGEVRAFYKLNRNVASAMFRNNLDFDENRGCMELGWSFPIHNQIRGLLQYFCGYGETLLDYDQYSQRFGIGLMLSDWL